MPIDALRASPALSVQRFGSFEEFLPFAPVGPAKNVPLRHKDSQSARAILQLKTCTIVLQQTFARILEMDYQTQGVIFLIPMAAEVDATINAVQLGGSSMAMICGKTPCDIFELRPNRLAIVSVNGPVPGYNWFHGGDGIGFVRAGRELERLQAVIRTAFRLVSDNPAIASVPGYVTALELALYSAIDRVQAEARPARVKRPHSLSAYRSIVRNVDDLLQTSPASPVYSHEVAAACGVSMRTVHSALAKVRGMSLHRYVMLRRLDDVRQQLLHADAEARIKRIALANGFWHLSEFSALYRRHYGEAPSDTLLRARVGDGIPPG